MSYHEIEVEKRWNVRCRDCNEVIGDALSTAGRAELLAEEHINKEKDDFSYPNYDHVVEVSEVTLIGRQLPRMGYVK